jgi:autotransporter-associated beta strand protein
MKKSTLALNSAAIFGASLCWLPNLSAQAVTYLADQNPVTEKADNSGMWGEDYTLISSVVITTGYEDIQSQSTTVPANTVTAPAIFIQINVNPGTAAFPTNIELNSNSNPNSTGDIGQWWADYDLALETVPGAGLVSSPTTVSNPYGHPVGISTGMNYFINGFNNKVTSPSTSGGNQVYNYSGGAWAQVAGVNQAQYSATTTSITPTSITYGIPLSELGLTIGQSFTFDAYSGFGGLPYSALDNASFAPSGYQPYTGNGGTQATAYDSATEPGSTLSTYTVTVPTLTWNNSFAAAGFGDGVTWDNNKDTNPLTVPANYNWNNGLFADYYVDGSNVIFNDVNNSTSSGGTNSSAYGVTLNTTVLPGSVVVNNSLGNYTISGSGTIGGTTSLTKSGTGTLTLSTANTYSGGTTVTAGKLLIGQAGSNAVITGSALTTSNTLTALPTGALSISGSGVVQLADGVTNQTFVTPNAGVGALHPTSNINLTSLSISGNGTLDIGNNRIIIDYTTGHDPIASIATWIKNGFSDGEAAGANPAIISSDIAADNTASGFSYGIGYADGADGAIAGLPSGEIEIMFTLLGDANLDGTVNSEDFTPFSNNLNSSGRSWDQGDFNYDGTVNSEDFTPFSHDLNQSASLAASETGTLLSPLIASGGLANVPEPASTGLLTMGLVSLLAHRRRKAKA